MFIRKENNLLSKHIEYSIYRRDKKIKRMPEEDKTAITEFYKLHNISYDGLTNYQQVIVFRRTVNFIFIVAYCFDDKPYAKYINPMEGPNKGFGIVRTQAYIFYKDGSLLYELDHNYQSYADNQIEERKLNKRNYDLHIKLKNEYLDKIGENGLRMGVFVSFCHELLKKDKTCKSIDFIKED